MRRTGGRPVSLSAVLDVTPTNKGDDHPSTLPNPPLGIAPRWLRNSSMVLYVTEIREPRAFGLRCSARGGPNDLEGVAGQEADVLGRRHGLRGAASQGGGAGQIGGGDPAPAVVQPAAFPH